jgi:hypothetical protein
MLVGTSYAHLPRCNIYAIVYAVMVLDLICKTDGKQAHYKEISGVRATRAPVFVTQVIDYLGIAPVVALCTYRGPDPHSRTSCTHREYSYTPSLAYSIMASSQKIVAVLGATGQQVCSAISPTKSQPLWNFH